MRHLALHSPGIVYVMTDIHGNLEDFERFRDLFLQARALEDVPVHWVILGDIVHGPSDKYRHYFDGLFDYDDESVQIVNRVVALMNDYPEHVHFVIGNHDYAHIGGRRTSKFHPDEADWLESQMTDVQIEAMHNLFHKARLVISTDCGVLMCHGSPDERMESFDRINRVQFPARGDDFDVVQDMLYAYGQRAETIDRVLQMLSEHSSYLHHAPLRVLLHGHDKDEDGYYLDDHNQLIPVLFGAPRLKKRYVVLDLSDYYESAEDLAQPHVLRHLYLDGDGGVHL